MKIKITAFFDPKKLVEHKEELNAFINKNGQNPFMHTSFIEKQIQSLSKESTPLILIFKVHENIVGFVPLLTTKKFGMQSTKFLLNYYFSPDFIFEENYRRACMETFLNFILEHLRYQFVSLDLPSDSPNLDTLRQICNDKSVKIEIKQEKNRNHAVMVNLSTWEKFAEAKGKKFSKKMEQIERKLSKKGKYEVKFFENKNNEKENFHQITDIEQGCWKHDWRQQNAETIDDDLLNLWSWSSLAVNSLAGFKRRVCFLYLNDKAIAYNFAIEYKETIYMCKTSFNNKYRQLYPGVYLINEAIKDSFNSKDVKMIDFMTNLPFHERWTHTRLLRSRVLLSNGLLPKLFKHIAKKLPKKGKINL